MKKPVRALSPIGLWYYVPWTITASCVLLVVGGIFFLVNSGKSANSVDEVLDLIGSTSSYNDTLTYNSAAWVVTLVLVILTILAGVALASVRTIEKVIRNYQLDTTAPYRRLMQGFQAAGSVALVLLMVVVAWVAYLVGIVATWYARTEVILYSSGMAMDRMGQCHGSKGCFDTSMMPFWTTIKCMCNATVLAEVYQHATTMQTYNRWCFVGVGLMLLGAMVGAALASATVALTIKNRGQLQIRYAELQPEGKEGTVAQLTARSEAASFKTPGRARWPRLARSNRGQSNRSASVTGWPGEVVHHTVLQVKPRSASADMDITTDEATDLEAGGLVQERKARRPGPRKSNKRAGQRRPEPPVDESLEGGTQHVVLWASAVAQ